MVGLLELLAAHGDGAAAKAALDWYKWDVEMRKGKAPQRMELQHSGGITVVDTLSAPKGTPVIGRPRRDRAPLPVVESHLALAEE